MDPHRTENACQFNKGRGSIFLRFTPCRWHRYAKKISTPQALANRHFSAGNVVPTPIPMNPLGKVSVALNKCSRKNASYTLKIALASVDLTVLRFLLEYCETS